MSLIDITAYDLDTPEGQSAALADMMDENNAQYDSLNSVTSLAVSGYQQLSINLAFAQPPGLYTKTFRHGLGFPPVVLGYGKNIAGGNYYLLPYLDQGFGAGNPFNQYEYFYVDSQFIYYNVLNKFSGTFQFTAGFYIFNIPLGS